MTNFINHIVLRHLIPGDHVRPRLRSRFEGEHNYVGNPVFVQDAGTGNGQSFYAQQTVPFTDRNETPGILPFATKPLRTTLQNPKEDSLLSDDLSNTSAPPFPQEEKGVTEQHSGKIKSNIFAPKINNHIPLNAGAAISEESIQKTAEERTSYTQVVKDISSNTASQKNTGEVPPNKQGKDLADGASPVLKTSQLVAAAAQQEKSSPIRIIAHASRQPYVHLQPDIPAQPVIKVTIGRIDVRAVAPPTPPPASSKTETKPRLSLEDYLNKRNQAT